MALSMIKTRNTFDILNVFNHMTQYIVHVILNLHTVRSCSFVTSAVDEPGLVHTKSLQWQVSHIFVAFHYKLVIYVIVDQKYKTTQPIQVHNPQ